ncbi:hypothetical protein EfsSVR2281_12500 [Enterococcus faecalis]|nr:hypothetical protein EfsSVR2281_12500 [Enterococcus faecalis]
MKSLTEWDVLQTIYNVVNRVQKGKTALDYWQQYNENKKNVVEKSFNYAHEVDYIKESHSWLDATSLSGERRRPVSCGMKNTLSFIF